MTQDLLAGDRQPRAQAVRRRIVFYIPGYDPVPPRRYREMYRSEGAAQADISGYTLVQGKRLRSGPGFGWSVEAQIDGQSTLSEVEFLTWTDIVQASMNKDIPRTYLLLARTAYEYIFSGALFRLMRLRIGPILAALYPVAMLLLQLAAAIFVATPFLWLGQAFVHAALGVVMWAAAIVLVLKVFRTKDNRFFVYYLMHDYGFSAQSKGENPPELEARIAEFRDTILAALSEDVDEVLVVGHSSGAHISVSVVADILRKLDGPPPADFALLTLGQVVPMVSFLRKAHRLRADLAYLADHENITWVDVSAPGDGANFALCDPVAVTGVAPENKRWPLMLSAAFRQTLSAERWNTLKRKFFRLHFQYLCAFDRPDHYDYFKITAGPVRLADLYAGRAPSPSRIETPVNRFTDTAAP